MKAFVCIFALSMATAASAQAQSMIAELCGAGHVNEIAARGDVMPNPNGYYVKSLQVQLTLGDPRIVQAVGSQFHLCLRSAATPSNDASRAAILQNEQAVKYLFVPFNDGKNRPGS